MYLRAAALVAELLESLAFSSTLYDTTPPPPYDREDSPPLYSPSEALVQPPAEKPGFPTSPPDLHRQSLPHQPDDGIMPVSIDFDEVSGVQSRGKAAKKAAKKAQQAKWLESDNEDAGQAGADGGGGGGGGDDNGSGAGGSGGGGGDDNHNNGDDGDDWFGGGSKKNKKKNKKKQEEEERKRQEEEDEKKKREEEDAMGGMNTLSWADDANEANANDDWTTSFSSKKDKKKKGKKVGVRDPHFPLMVAFEWRRRRRG